MTRFHIPRRPWRSKPCEPARHATSDRFVPILFLGALAVAVGGCGSDQIRTSQPAQASPLFAVLSTFPAEMAPVLEQTTVNDSTVINGHSFRIGTLGGVPVVVGLTGIGLVNAATTTRAVLEQFPVTGVVVSAVGGSSSLDIADVAVPAAWEMADGTTYASDPTWLDLAGEIASSGGVSLEDCTTVPPAVSTDTICLPNQPVIAVGGIGQSSDPYNGQPLPCQPNGGDVFGCDVGAGFASAAEIADPAIPTLAPADTATPLVVDMETAAIAAEAAARGVPFIAFRAITDGRGDPLGLPGFPEQFFAYYPISAHNAAAATAAFLERIAAGSAH